MAGGSRQLSGGNVGHQMMKRMGWEGAGLGATEQGIQEPIKGGDVRDKVDKYKVWCSVSVYECGERFTHIHITGRGD